MSRIVEDEVSTLTLDGMLAKVGSKANLHSGYLSHLFRGWNTAFASGVLALHKLLNTHIQFYHTQNVYVYLGVLLSYETYCTFHTVHISNNLKMGRKNG